ncbi:MAG: hypothetical protein J6J23_02505, partial [Clostridia bacterium]|nr:hypothetical protein [Clostridia bacterium]
AIASLTNVKVDIDNDIFYYATAFNKNDEGAFIIEDYTDLEMLSQLVKDNAVVPDTDNFLYRDATFVIVNDITAPDITVPDRKTFTPIGTNDAPFSGVIYGDKWDNGTEGDYTGFGVTLSNVKIDSSASVGGNMYAGLFGYIDGAVIQNIGLDETCEINTPNISYVGGIVGSAVSLHGSNLIENCYNYAPVTASYNVGGIIGSINGNTTIKNCYNTGKLLATGVTSGNANAGGIAGLVSGSNNKIEGVYNIGEIYASSTSLTNVNSNNRTTGGIVGNPKTVSTGLTISNAYYLNTCLVNEQGQMDANGDLISIGSTGGLGTMKDIVCMSDIDALEEFIDTDGNHVVKMTGLAGMTYTDKYTGTQKSAWIPQHDTNDKYFFPQLAIFNPTKYETLDGNAINGFDYDWFHLPKNYAVIYFPNGGTWRDDILDDTMNIEGTPGGGALVGGLAGGTLTDHYNASKDYEFFYNSSNHEDLTMSSGNLIMSGYVFAGWKECDEFGNFLTGDTTRIQGAGFFTNDAGYVYGIKKNSYGNIYLKANWVKVGATKGPNKDITYGDNTNEELSVSVSLVNETGAGIVSEAGRHKIIYRWYQTATQTNTGGTEVA